MNGTATRNGSSATPYLAGALLGLTAGVSLAIFEHGLWSSSAFAQIAGFAGVRLVPNGIYWRYVVRPGITWPVWLQLGVFLGAFASSVHSDRFRVRTIPESGWTDVFGWRVSTRWVIAFLGAAMVQFGAGIAGGCASGLAISGGVVLAPAAFVFMAAMFAGGIPVALLLGSIARRRRGESPHDVHGAGLAPLHGGAG